MSVLLDLETHMQLWNQVQVDLIDMRLCATAVPMNFSLPSNGFICAAENIQSITFNNVRYSETTNLILHGCQGTTVQLSPRLEQGRFYLLLYQTSWPAHTDPQLVELAQRVKFTKEIFAVHTTHENSSYDLLHHIARSWQTRQSGSALQAKALFLSFLYEWVQLRHQHNLSKTIDPIASLITYIHDNYAQALSLAQLAEQANYSIAHLIALFKETTGYAPIDYLTRLRIEKAQQLLSESALPLPAIAEQVGYRDPYYFGRLFKRLTGLSPMQYKRTVRSDSIEPPRPVPKLLVKDHVSPQLFKRPDHRTIEHTLGEVKLSAVPQRIVALDWTTAEFLLALGIVPIGISELDGLHRWVNLPLKLPKGILDVGARVSPDLDQIAALNPDLIVGTHMLLSPHYEALQRIAPTIVYELFPASMHTSEFSAMEHAFAHLAVVLDRKSLADAVSRKLNDSLIEMREYLGSIRLHSHKAILAFGFSQSDHSIMRIAHDLSLSVDALERLGLSNGFMPGQYEQAGFSTHMIDEMSIDDSAQLLYVVQHDDRTAIKRLQQENHWKMLNPLSRIKQRSTNHHVSMIWPYGGPISVHRMSTAITQALSLSPS